MSLKFKAALQTLATIVFITLMVLGLQQLSTMLTVTQVGIICSGVLLTWLVYIMYLVLLNRLEYEQKVDEITKG